MIKSFLNPDGISYFILFYLYDCIRYSRRLAIFVPIHLSICDDHDSLEVASGCVVALVKLWQAIQSINILTSVRLNRLILTFETTATTPRSTVPNFISD